MGLQWQARGVAGVVLVMALLTSGLTSLGDVRPFVCGSVSGSISSCDLTSFYKGQNLHR